MSGAFTKVQCRSAAGIYAAGDAAQLRQNATLASADGVLAGVSLHQSLVFDQR